MLKRLFCKHNLLTFVRKLTKEEIISELKHNRSAENLFKCKQCGKLIKK